MKDDAVETIFAALQKLRSDEVDWEMLLDAYFDDGEDHEEAWDRMYANEIADALYEAGVV